jgi:hypothetical protein
VAAQLAEGWGYAAGPTTARKAAAHLYSGTLKAGELPSPACDTTAASTEASRTMAIVSPERACSCCRAAAAASPPPELFPSRFCR